MIFHITNRKEWEEALRRGRYEAASLGREGFIHCSTREQTAGTANRFFCGQSDLVLLSIDPGRLTADLRYECPADPKDERSHEQFPHVYGPINLDAVSGVSDFLCENGSFQVPAGL